MGCDINRHHVEWCNTHLSGNGFAFHNSSIPSFPVPDGSVDLISAFSVFTHIEAMETAWLMEIRRMLRPGGIAWITVHTEKTLADMEEGWPLWDPVMCHPRAADVLGADRSFEGDRLVLRWTGERSYASNTFYKEAYLRRAWGRFFRILELRRRCPTFQDVLILQKQ
jgi:ubiquinone/menaquinone biosynthesis C-methylase UbiE